MNDLIFVLVTEQGTANCYSSLCSCCRVDVIALGLLLVLHWVGLMYVIVACPGHTHMLYTACVDPERFARGVQL